MNQLILKQIDDWIALYEQENTDDGELAFKAKQIFIEIIVTKQ